MRAVLSEDRQTIHLRGALWRSSIAVEDLDRWIAFYRAMRDRVGGKYAKHYNPTLRALEAVKKRLATQVVTVPLT